MVNSTSLLLHLARAKNRGRTFFCVGKTVGQPVVCTGVGHNGFPQQEYAYGGVTVADFTGDGKMEIAIAVHETGIRIFSNTGTGPCGPWEEQSNVPESVRTFRSRAIVTADMNKDGRVDLVALSEAPGRESNDEPQGLGILWNEASGWRFEGIEGSRGLFGDDVAIGEVNGDGVPDIATGSLNDTRPQFLWLSDGNGKWHAVSAEGLPSHIIAWSVQLVDLDNDGKDGSVVGRRRGADVPEWWPACVPLGWESVEQPFARASASLLGQWRNRH